MAQHRIFVVLCGLFFLISSAHAIDRLTLNTANTSVTLSVSPFMASQREYHERTWQDATGFYVIGFDIDMTSALIPMTNPPGQPHYAARITVALIVDGQKHVLDILRGQWTPEGCFEDDPATLVRIALEQQEIR